MQFYKYEGFSADEGQSEEIENRRVMREKARAVAMKTSDFNRRLQRRAYLFVTNPCEDVVTVGVIMRDPGNVRKLISDYLRAIGIELKNTAFEELTLNSFRNMLSCADRQDCIADDAVLEQFDLDKLVGRRGIIEFGENIIDECDRKTVYADAGRFLAADTMIPELDRIYAGSISHTVSGHPVHYMISTDDRESRKGMCRVLLQALFANGRLKGRRYSFLDVVPGEPFSRGGYDCLYKSSAGGAVVVRYMADGSDEDDHANCARDTIGILCETMKKYRNQVLTIFCLPRECTGTKDIFYEMLGSTGIVELKEDYVSGERAKSFLKGLAKDNGIRTDKKLFAKLGDGSGYLAPDLHDMFDDWYNDKLKTGVYPQYKDISSVKRELIKAPPRGSAYEELNRMIGLGEAKKVINQVLNYCKAQKLFSDRGMKTDHPAMHMVFTGNPGTAKTSVARLFARIMRENNVLSKGDLIEVGRGDLVGKYVGWTADKVKKKFEEAKGCVLFIDEAYSLVDEKNGSFGDEAINTIVQEMENHRDDVAVILAGYPDKMDELMKKNPGLRSRIAYHVPFDDYDTEELCGIAKHIAMQKGLVLDDEADAKLRGIFDAARTESDFGNGRYVRNVIEKARMAQASRLLNMDYDSIGSKDIATIRAEDIELPKTANKQEKTKIGFCA